MPPTKQLPQAIAIVIDNIGGSYIVVTMNELLDLYRERLKRSHEPGRHFTFTVERRRDKYFLVMPDDRPNEPLLNVDTMQPVVDLLRRLKEKHVGGKK